MRFAPSPQIIPYAWFQLFLEGMRFRRESKKGSFATSLGGGASRREPRPRA